MPRPWGSLVGGRVTVPWSVETDPETSAGGTRLELSWGICMLAHTGVLEPPGLGSTKEIAGYGVEGVCWGCPPNLHACSHPSLPSLPGLRVTTCFLRTHCVPSTLNHSPTLRELSLTQQTRRAALSPAVPSGTNRAKHLPPGGQSITPGCEAQQTE